MQPAAPPELQLQSMHLSPGKDSEYMSATSCASSQTCGNPRAGKGHTAELHSALEHAHTACTVFSLRRPALPCRLWEPQASPEGTPVSWLSMKVTEREGHQPMRPGGLFSLSRRRQYCVLATASARMPLVGKSNSVHPPALSSQSHSTCRGPFWLCSSPSPP